MHASFYRQFYSHYNASIDHNYAIIVIYNRRAFIRLATDLSLQKDLNFFSRNSNIKLSNGQYHLMTYE